MTLRARLFMVTAAFLIFSGCAMKTYEIQQERVDQDLTTGNRGLVKGTVPRDDIKDRKTTRPIKVLELELPSLKKGPGQQTAHSGESVSAGSAESEQTVTVFEDYKVQQYDTLQKISRKFYGSIHKWSRIYDANRDVLKSPDSIYPGQTLKIPVAQKTK